MSLYRSELEAAERRSQEAYEAMEAWLSRPLDAPDVPGAVLEGHAKVLRDTREWLHALVAEHGIRDDLAAALERNQEYHRRLGLSVRDKPEPPAAP